MAAAVGPDTSSSWRSSSLPELGASSSSWKTPNNAGSGQASPSSSKGLQQQPAKSGSEGGLKAWLPLLDRRSIVYGVGYETCRRNEVIERLEHFRSKGDLPRLWAAVRRAKMDAALDDTPTVNEMSRIFTAASKQRTMCENVARRVEESRLTTKDVGVLKKALKELEQLRIGPNLWKDPVGNRPTLGQVEALLPHLETLQELVKAHRAGSASYCSAWLEMMDSGKLRSSINLEVSTAKWLLAFADSATVLGGVVSEDVKFEYWRLVESIERTGSEPLSSSSELAPKDAHLTKILALAGSLSQQTSSPRRKRNKSPKK